MVERLIENIQERAILKVVVKSSDFEDLALMMIANPALTESEAMTVARKVFPKLNIHSVMLGMDYELYSSKFDRAVAHFEKTHDWVKEPNVAITFYEDGDYFCWTFEI